MNDPLPCIIGLSTAAYQIISLSRPQAIDIIAVIGDILSVENMPSHKEGFLEKVPLLIEVGLCGTSTLLSELHAISLEWGRTNVRPESVLPW